MRGIADPTLKAAAELTAASTGRALECSVMPSSSARWMASASRSHCDLTGEIVSQALGFEDSGEFGELAVGEVLEFPLLLGDVCAFGVTL
ncbi:MAG: hypothetical protein RIS71_1291 [Actinomycetota bacterium]